MRPGTVGNHQRILVSELSGQSNVLMKAEELNIPLEKGSDEAKAILQDLTTYEQTQESLALLKMLAQSNRSLEAGRTKPASKVISELRRLVAERKK